MNEPLLSARALTKTYAMGKRTLEVLRGVNLDVARGEFLALRGASGAGKSTLLHLIGGLDTPNAGEIHFAGQNLAAFSERELTEFRNHRVGFVFQAYHLLPELTALENVCLPARVARVPAAQAVARGSELLAQVGLAERMEHKPFELSGGEQQRVAIARALVNEPDLLLADEPTGNLDSHTGGEILELLKSLRAKKQTTLVIATHDAHVAANAPRVVELVDGQIAAAGDSLPMSRDYWEARYQSGDMRWEKGAPSPGLVDFLAAHPALPRGVICVPGCGAGHDVREFAKAGFAALGFDIAPSAIQLAVEKTKAAGLNAGFQRADFLQDDPPQLFDWIFEHTLFCAIKPDERNDYVRAVLRWLRPEGQYLAVNYMIVEKGEGPPFCATREELWQRFSPHFELVAEWVPRSYPNRVGRERMFWWRRKAG